MIFQIYFYFRRTAALGLHKSSVWLCWTGPTKHILPDANTRKTTWVSVILIILLLFFGRLRLKFPKSFLLSESSEKVRVTVLPYFWLKPTRCSAFPRLLCVHGNFKYFLDPAHFLKIYRALIEMLLPLLILLFYYILLLYSVLLLSNHFSGTSSIIYLCRLVCIIWIPVLLSLSFFIPKNLSYSFSPSLPLLCLFVHRCLGLDWDFCLVYIAYWCPHSSFLHSCSFGSDFWNSITGSLAVPPFLLLASFLCWCRLACALNLSIL